MDKTEPSQTNLSLINNIKFTSREIDVIAAILNNRGEKKIAAILSISHRTVSAHVHNIMLKTAQNSKDGIIDFIERAGKNAEFNLHYQELLAHIQFQQYLAKIRKQTLKKEITFEISSQESKVAKPYINDLKIAGIDLCFSSDIKAPLVSEILQDCHRLNYYEKVIYLIEKITKIEDITKLVGSFSPPQGTYVNTPPPTAKATLYKKKNLILISICFLLLLGFLYKEFFAKTKIIARSNIQLPHSSILLQRPKILEQIEKILSKKEGISVAILLGEEGTGKTILARNYAKSQDRSIIWEVDAASTETLLSSFEKLAYFLLESKEDREEMEYIEKVVTSEAKIKKLEYFIEKKARIHENWLIIYNNVHSFNAISQYFPHDNKVWGNGSVIIITRNHDIKNHPYIAEKSIIPVKALSKEEKKQLFTKVISPKSKQIDESFAMLLARIPPYPFDVQHVANYIKKENISCKQYLLFLQLKEDEISNQKSASYRKQIINKSVQHILSQSSDFQVPFILISTLANKNIPRNLLEFADQNTDSNKFLSTIQRLAFIEEMNTKQSSFSINESLQKATLENLRTMPFFREASQKASKILNDYFAIKLNQNNIEEVRSIIPHIESFLQNLDTDDDLSKAELYLKLGNSFFDLGAYGKAKKYFYKSEKISLQYYTKLHPKIIHLYTRIGVLHRNMGNYIDAQKYLQNALTYSKKIYSESNQEIALTYIYLGSVYRNLGEFSKAYEYTIQGSKLLTSSPNTPKKEIAKADAYLGCIYINLGNYNEAQKMLEKSLGQYQELYKDTHTKTSWIKTKLAIVYGKKGLLLQAKQLLSEARQNYLELCGDNALEYAWTSTHLGIILNELGETAQGNQILEESIRIYQKHYSPNHQTISWAKKYIKKI